MVSAMVMCLALNIYHEARGESYIGQVAVSEVVRNRTNKLMWSQDACTVIWQPAQFSWTIDYKARNENTQPYYAPAIMSLHSNYANGADHYHNLDILPPDWTDDMEVVQVIGNHIFYRSNYD